MADLAQDIAWLRSMATPRRQPPPRPPDAQAIASATEREYLIWEAEEAERVGFPLNWGLDDEDDPNDEDAEA
jgi:hypothetical protein